MSFVAGGNWYQNYWICWWENKGGVLPWETLHCVSRWGKNALFFHLALTYIYICTLNGKMIRYLDSFSGSCSSCDQDLFIWVCIVTLDPSMTDWLTHSPLTMHWFSCLHSQQGTLILFYFSHRCQFVWSIHSRAVAYFMSVCRFSTVTPLPRYHLACVESANKLKVMIIVILYNFYHSSVIDTVAGEGI